MKNRFILGVVVTIVLGIITFYPKDIIGIIGKEPYISENAHVRVISRENIEDSGIAHESQSQEHAKEIFDYFTEYKFRRTNKSYSDLDEMASYTIKITDEGEEMFFVTIRGDKYISITDKRDNYFSYKLWGDEFDLDYIEEYYQSLNN